MKTRSLAIIMLFCLGVVLKGYPQQFRGFVMSGVTPDNTSLNEAVNLMNLDDAEINQMIAQSPLDKTTYDNFEKRVSSHVATVGQLYGKYLKSLGLAANNQQTAEFEQRMANVYTKSQKVTYKNPDGTISITPSPSTFTPAASNAGIGNNNTFTPTVNYAANGVQKKSDDYESEYENKNIKLTADNSAAAQSENTVKNVTNVSDLNFDNVNIPVTNATPTAVTNIANNSGMNTPVTASNPNTSSSSANGQTPPDASNDQNGIDQNVPNTSERQRLDYLLASGDYTPDQKEEIKAINNVVNDPESAIKTEEFFSQPDINSSGDISSMANESNSEEGLLQRVGQGIIGSKSWGIRGLDNLPSDGAEAWKIQASEYTPSISIPATLFIGSQQERDLKTIKNTASNNGLTGTALSSIQQNMGDGGNNVDFDPQKAFYDGSAKKLLPEPLTKAYESLMGSHGVQDIVQYATDHPAIATASITATAIVLAPTAAVAGTIIFGSGGAFLAAKRFISQ